MLRRLSILGVCVAAGIVSAAALDNQASSHSALTAAEIVNKNVAARGGLQAWRGVQALSLSGKLGAGGNQRDTLATPGAQVASRPQKAGIAEQGMPARRADEVFLPFVMELKRPRKERFELTFNGQTALQVYDGANGWKLRPYLNRRVVEPYTPEEAKIAALQQDLDGPLVDYAAKGSKVELVGMEKVEDRDTYNLLLTMKNGQALHVWIDAQTFLETKIQGTPRRLDGVEHPVEVYYRDYRAANGLQIPFLLETKVLPVARPGKGVREPAVPVEKTIIEKVLVNPKFDEKLFLKPEAI